MLQTFLPLFLMTFGICLFIVLMQFLWRYIDDMVGKGLGIPVLGGNVFLCCFIPPPHGIYLWPFCLASSDDFRQPRANAWNCWR